MNDAESAGVTAPPSSGEPRARSRITRLTAAPSLALTALAAPVTVAVRIASHLGDPQTVAIAADDCRNAFATSAFHTLKWPLCGGD